MRPVSLWIYVATPLLVAFVGFWLFAGVVGFLRFDVYLTISFALVGVGTALLTWNAHKTGRIRMRYSTVERESQPGMFRLFIVYRIVFITFLIGVAVLSFLQMWNLN